jgi:hypothetical protein
MKASLILLAAVSGIVAAPIDFTAMVSALFCAGFSVIVLSDYRRERPSIDVLARSRGEPLRLAA